MKSATAVKRGLPPITTQVNIRVGQDSIDKWKEACERQGKNLSEFIRDIVNKEADKLVACQHPVGMRTFHAWENICTQCGARV